MTTGNEEDFELHPALAADCAVVGDLPLCRVLLMGDRNYPWLILVPRACYVLKVELLKIPIFGSLARPAGMIPVDRDGGGAALRALMKEGARAAGEGRQIVIFPEGTRAEPGVFPPLQPGIAALAAATKLPVVPVVTDSGDFWGRRAFRKQPGTIRLVILPPLPAGMARGALMAQLEAAIQAGMTALRPDGRG